MNVRYEVTVAAGALRSESEGIVRFEHRWSAEGVTVQGAFTGAHLLHVDQVAEIPRAVRAGATVQRTV